MNALKKVIGLAPSEVPFDIFIDRLKEERSRIGRNLVALRSPKMKKKSVGAKKTSKPRTLKALAKRHGMTEAELTAKLLKAGVEL